MENENHANQDFPFSRICRSTYGRLPEQEFGCYEPGISNPHLLLWGRILALTSGISERQMLSFNPAEFQIRLTGCRCLFRNMPNTSPKWAKSLCRWAFRMVGCWRNTSPETSPSVSPFLEDPFQPPLRGGASRGSLRRGGTAFPPATAHKNHLWQLSRWEA